MASKALMHQFLRGLIGDKPSFRNKLWYQPEDLDDILKMAIFRHNPQFDLNTLPDEQITVVCYRAAIDICHELAARNAPFNQLQIEGSQFDKSGVMNNWLTLADRYKEMYQLEMQGGLGAEGQILYGELTRFSYTTGREVPYRQVTAFPTPTLSVYSVDGLTVTLRWTTTRHQDFYVYKVYRSTDGTTWTEVALSYDPLRTEFSETLEEAGSYDYKVEVWRGIAFSPEANFPWSPRAGNYLTTPSNTVSVEVSEE